MSPEKKYSAFRCDNNIVVFHQHGHGDSQALLIFREPQRIVLHDKTLIVSYAYSNEVVTLLDDPLHEAAEVLNAIALSLRIKEKANIKCQMKALVCAVAGAMIASSVWLALTL